MACEVRHHRGTPPRAYSGGGASEWAGNGGGGLSLTRCGQGVGGNGAVAQGSEGWQGGREKRAGTVVAAGRGGHWRYCRTLPVIAAATVACPQLHIFYPRLFCLITRMAAGASLRWTCGS